MARKKFTAEQIIVKLREIEVWSKEGQAISKACKRAEITQNTCYDNEPTITEGCP